MALISDMTSRVLTSDHVESLRAAGITTLFDIVIKEKSHVMTSGHLTLAEYEALKVETLQLIQPSPTYASSIISQDDYAKKHSTGIDGLDKLLNGGISGGEILEIFGDPGTGKSQLCMWITSHFLHRSKSSVIYFDLKGNFSAKRVLEFCKGAREDLANVEIIRPTSLAQVMNELETIKTKIVEGLYPDLKLMIFDSVPMVIYPVVDKDFKSWRYYPEILTTKLSQFDDKIVVIFVNHVVNRKYGPEKCEELLKSSTASMKGAMGSYWTHKSNFRLYVTRESEFFKGILLKSSRTQSGIDRAFRFLIQPSKIFSID